ncbi:hypothetical protein FXO38_32725 [Capsicum annuum]|uniref:uncharacterized protein LOC107866741 isoform X1 n=1 Tax=Capsicum annuum TaxID=4072 RepID=UPI0007BF8E5F|nr:uncharacterized protein LOC107866741 isoform X1 [Capsicum annuum]KAF3619825.1 hypothetical protein FXO38_32725 [Capsicum annuum]KAF3684806.1 hypothetical protein FXO37_01166 [Capsicum annuum]
MLRLDLDCPSPAAPSPSYRSSSALLPCQDHVLNMSPRPEGHVRALVDDHSSFSGSNSHASNKFQRNCVNLQSSMELMKEISSLEIEIMHLERYLLSLYRTAFQQNIPALLENQKIHSQGKISSPTQCTTDQSYSDVEQDMLKCGADQYDRISTSCALAGSSDHIQTAKKSLSIREKLTDSGHRSLADHLTASRMDDVLSYPDRLSEEIVRCISCIYCKFANPEILAQKGSSVSSTSSLSSSSTFSPRNLSGSWSSHHNESTEQYEFEVYKDDDNRPNSTMIEILKICLDDDSFNYATTMLHKFRSLVKSLEKIDPRNMKREEKLTFWINIHNALVMHAYLAYGTQNSVRSSSILKAAYNVGGHCVNAYVIQSSILGIRPHYSAPWLQTLFSPGKKLATANSRHTYAIEYPEPLVHFALSLGASSDPAIQVYTAKNVFQDLKVAKEEFIRSTVCINKDKRIYLPKIICYFAKDMSLSTDGLLETVMGCLPETQMKLVRSCMKDRADKLIYWLPQSWTFRYLIQKQVIKGRLSI